MLVDLLSSYIRPSVLADTGGGSSDTPNDATAFKQYAKLFGGIAEDSFGSFIELDDHGHLKIDLESLLDQRGGGKALDLGQGALADELPGAQGKQLHSALKSLFDLSESSISSFTQELKASARCILCGPWRPSAWRQLAR